MYIKALKLTNFCGHADTYIEFDEITSLVGISASGKSSLIKALKLLLHNEDWPEILIRDGQDWSEGEIWLTSGAYLKRTRTLKGQRILLIDSEGIQYDLTGKKDAQKYVEKVLDIRKVTLDEVTGPEDLNFVGIYDGPEVIGKRSDTIQRRITGIIGAAEVEDAKNRLNKELRECNKQFESTYESVELLGTKVKSQKPLLDEMNQALKKTQDFEDRWNERKNQLEELLDIDNHLKVPIITTISTNQIIINIQNIRGLIKRLKALLDKLNLVNSIQDSFISPIIPINPAIIQLISDIKQNISVIISKISGIKDILILNNELKQINKEYISEIMQREQLYTEFSELNYRKELILEKYGICPTCKQPVKP